ncbi:FAD-dependent oxidoreductase [Pedobacter nototheniae]|uniref:FAD-dependent oxidoreductase n=1 Tax=Pedobacter nototheniae TaxID=2488994 RepID=UPI0029307ACC|nr:FAD-dependent oxidoreductase [Pedobacter nototheniae]
MKHIVIIGGGFAGINLANGLSKKEGFKVTLVDKNNYHFFPPLLYQVSTAFLGTKINGNSYPHSTIEKLSSSLSWFPFLGILLR